MIPFNEVMGVVPGELERKGGKYPALVQSTAIKHHLEHDLRWELPGWGEPGNECGEFLKAISCPGHGRDDRKHDRGIVLKHCYDPACPTCYEAWAIREGNRATERLTQAQALYFSSGLDLWDVKHITFSPPQEDAKKSISTASGYKKLKSQSIKMMKRAGMKGGAIVFHALRQRKSDKGWYLSPHFHVIGFGYLTNSDEFYKKTGWIYKSMGKRNSIAGTIIYTLTHCGLAYDNGVRVFHALTWFGLISYNKIVKASEEKEDVEVPCTCCKTSLHEYELELNDEGHCLIPNWTVDKGIYIITKKRIKYKLRDKFKLVYDPEFCGYKTVKN